MASSSDRFRFQTPSGIPYALNEEYPKFGGGNGGHTATEQLIIDADSFEAFVIEAFPNPTVNPGQGGAYRQPTRRRLPGAPLFQAVSYDAEPFLGGRPGDPFSVDLTANSNTYDDLIRMTIQYEIRPNVQGNEEEFLEIQVQAGAQVLSYNGTNGMKLVEANQAPMQDVNLVVQESENPGADDFILDGNVADIGDEHNAANGIPAQVVFPTMEWSITWKKVLWPPWRAIRKALGKVNDRKMKIFDHALADSILFLGVSGRQTYTSAGVYPWNLTYRFSEKAFTARDANGEERFVTWGYFFSPQHGEWRLLRLPNGRRAYEPHRFKQIFEYDRVELPPEEEQVAGNVE